MFELQGGLTNYNNEFLKVLKKDLLEFYTGEDQEKLVHQFIHKFSLKLFDQGINLGKFLYSFNNRGKKQNYKNENVNQIAVDLGQILDGIFNILILDIGNNKTYYFTCYLEEITESYAIDGVNSDSILKILDNDKNLFKDYILDLMLSTGFTFQNFLELIIQLEKNKGKDQKDFQIS